MLTLAGNLKHDATIMRIRGWLSIVGHRVTNTVASFEVDSGLWVGSEDSTIATVPDPGLDSDEASWLWKHNLFTLTQGDGTLAGVNGMLQYQIPVDIKAMRRFRENFNTLWWILNVDNAGYFGSATLTFKGRTLLRVP